LKILVAATQPPVPPINGVRLPLLRLAHGFAGRGHDVLLLALADAEERRAEVPAHWRLLPGAPRATSTRRALWLARATVSGRPMRVDDVAAALRPAIERQLDDFAPDVFFGVGFELAALPRLACPSVLAVLDAVHLNVRAQAAAATGIRRMLFDREARRVRRFEANGYGRFDRVVVVSPQDGTALRELNPHLHVDVIPNGVDAEEYRPIADVDPTPGRLLLHGTMDYEPNVRAAEFLVDDVLPLVRAEHAAAHVVVVGRSPSKRVRALEGPHVTVTGEVDEVGPWLSSAAVYVCPMVTGTGVKNKLLEAMASERACVVTSLALRGLTAEPGRDLLVGADAAGLAASISALLGDSARRRILGASARRYVVEHHSWDAVTAEYDAALARAIASRRLSSE
jgi:glycosyltransferase involved in cell wall biosynthesis